MRGKGGWHNHSRSIHHQHGRGSSFSRGACGGSGAAGGLAPGVDGLLRRCAVGGGGEGSIGPGLRQWIGHNC
ncbi:hypothetical protein ART_4254 [Arthrobacter sp. PAMC 25486]|nr:hypothetical protein ART_4254 [Arthrobacter sp. PAMC 25486]